MPGGGDNGAASRGFLGTGLALVVSLPAKSCKLGGGLVAERTGLEPATSGVTGRRSNQLSYRSASVGAQAKRIPSLRQI